MAEAHRLPEEQELMPRSNASEKANSLMKYRTLRSWLASFILGFLSAAAIFGILAGVLVVVIPPRTPDLISAQTLCYALFFQDAATKQVISLVTATTPNGISFVSDNAGSMAICDSDLLGRRVWFTLSSPGYAYPPDFMGLHGLSVDLTPGNSSTVLLQRTIKAERIYRITGAGLYHHATTINRQRSWHTATPEPLVPIPIDAEEAQLNSGVVGLDSIQNAVFQGISYFFFGDTVPLTYPLGIFAVTGATVATLDVDKGLNLTYFEDRTAGFVRPMTSIPPFDKPTWLSGLVAIPKAPQLDAMVAFYSKVAADMHELERGLLQWNPTLGFFEPIAVLPLDDPMADPLSSNIHVRRYPDHPGTLFFCRPFPTVRLVGAGGPGSLFNKMLQNFTHYEGYTALPPGCDPYTLNGTARVLSACARQLTRDNVTGELLYGWRAHTPPLEGDLEAQLVAAGVMRAAESRWSLVDVETGRPVRVVSGDVQWNLERSRYVLVGEASGAPESALGEVYYSEAEKLEGPWTRAVKIASHPGYSFYNPVHLGMFDSDAFIYFAGTYSNTFSGTQQPVPRADYNNLMYSLDLRTVAGYFL
ncbi:putative coagulation factor 5/8 type domain protein [Paratrimastix pyriformis]|uniref:Coagulation factor 5/8 type domain protein n=1 Tax=Paratrimastix pyriformis TaxID=342808 RepID=A0ABQ8USK9_9EUKA|nr:putative coagulation factor 5/8 type domain protein [Paratrimastix pyriformis]